MGSCQKASGAVLREVSVLAAVQVDLERVETMFELFSKGKKEKKFLGRRKDRGAKKHVEERQLETLSSEDNPFLCTDQV